MWQHDLPADQDAWEDKVEELRLKKQWSIHESKHKNSGSKFTLEQFILLRVLWPSEISQAGFEAAYTEFIEPSNLKTAREFLQSLSSWQRYLETFDDEECRGMDGRVLAKYQGTFALVRHYQNLSCKDAKVKRAEENEDSSWEERVLSPLTPTLPLTGVDAKSFGVVEDEQIVNAALIDFLNALTLHCDKVKGEWFVRPKALHNEY